MSAPTSVEQLDVAEQAEQMVETQRGYPGESPWEYARGVAAALAWVRGEGGRPALDPRCDACSGRGAHGAGPDEECPVCYGSGVAP